MDSSFQEVDLRPESTNNTTSDDVHIRPQSRSKIQGFFSGAFRKTFSRKNKRRFTAPTAELVKNSISLPTSCNQVTVSEEDLNRNVTPIQSCPFDITGYGPFLLMDEFRVQKPKKATIMVFLYEKVLIFTKKTSDDDSYYYMGSLKMEQIALMPLSKHKKLLELKDHLASTRFHKDVIISLEAPTEYIQMQWRKAVEKCLWGQLLKAKREGGIGKL